jgi:parvulin-like peptidyl-prolyl isomerase
VGKRLVAALLVVLLAGTVGTLVGCGGDLSGNAVAKVGKETITKKDLDAKVADFQAQYPGQFPDETSDPQQFKQFQQSVLEYLITVQLGTQQAASLGVTVTDEELQKEMDTILAESFSGDQAAFDKALADQGMTMDQFKATYKESMVMEKVYTEVTKGVTTIPDTEIAAYYEKNKADYFVDETRKARHILIAPIASRSGGTTSTTTTSSTTSTTLGSSDSSSTTGTASSTTTAPASTTTTAAPTDADWNTALEIAKKVRADLVSGIDWTIEAAKYSDDDTTKKTGGDLGTVFPGQMVPEFEDAVYKQLAKDEISEPVKTSYGYHIIQVTAIDPARQHTLEEVKDQITSALLGQKKQEAWVAWIEKMKQQVGVTYGKDWATTTTTTAAPTETTTGPTDTTSTSGPTTTSGGSTTTTASTTSTTAKP